MGKILGYFDSMLLNNNLLSTNIESSFKQRPRVHILEEKEDGEWFIRRQTWDIISEEMTFNPVAFSIVKIKKNSSVDISLLDPFDQEVMTSNHTLHFVTADILKNELYDEVKEYISEPFFGRKSLIYQNDQIIAETYEFISDHPKMSTGLSLINYIMPEPSEDLTVARFQDALLHINNALESPPSLMLYYFLNKLPKDEFKNLLEEIVRIEHIALMVPPKCSFEQVSHLLTHSYFPLDHCSYDSQILAKELGQLCNKDIVPTKIFKAWGTNHKNERIGVELFFPDAPEDLVCDWIHSGIGSHVAFEVKTQASLPILTSILGSYGYKIADFMNRTPMKNTKEGCVILYFDVTVQDRNFTLELFYRNQ